MYIFVLCAMLFMHVLDDYVLQAPCLCKLKQKSFWEQHAPQKRYKYDYVVALVMHALSWSFMIMLPIAWALNFHVSADFAVMFMANAVFHALVDDLKANQYKINLVIDQVYHLFQIGSTFTLFYFGII